MPVNTVYVGRPSKWGNPFTVHGDSKKAVDLYRGYIWELFEVKGTDWFLKELRGKNLACWCSLDQPCHADILLEIANS